ncbi:hypothetical protein SLEP1_g27718 [Rubroshorea leprosula]|uniref:Uncharacterized protein n=1 Tax=Rubroshorea leprosula TaxID=152421 RepID=A0AAV5K0L3_9ROSI|nr:hypothetical protein SLEP1_g27718 [Rubroshorea leprosula]
MTHDECYELITSLNSLDRMIRLASAPFANTVGDPIRLVLKICPCFDNRGWMNSSKNRLFF